MSKASQKKLRKTKKKRKVSLQEISKCHPRSTSKQKCLPDTVYSELSSKLHTGNVFESVGCKNGEEHCLLDKAPLADDVKKQLRKQYLRPIYPKAWEKDPDMWLDNFNIMDVMRQYEQALSLIHI